MNEQPQFQKIADELAIRKVFDEYCLRLEVNTFEEWLELFTEDSVYEVFRQTLQGRQAIADMLSQAPEGIHFGGAARITLDGDTAETVQNYLFIEAGSGEWNRGWYFRTMVRIGSEWKIAHMKVKLQK